MNIEHVLHPEILLDIRGDEDHRKSLREQLSCITLSDNGCALDTSNASPQIKEFLERAFSSVDGSMKQFLMQCKEYRQQKGQVYYLSQSFCRELSEMQRDLHSKYFPESFLGYIALPKGYQVSEKKIVNGAYVRLIPAKIEHPKFGVASRMMLLSYTINIEGPGNPFVNTSRLAIWDGLTISESIEEAIKAGATFQNKDHVEQATKLANIVVNALLFITHEKENILLLKTAGTRSNRERAALREQGSGALNLSSVRIHLLSIDSFLPREYSMDSTTVRGHLRMVPCGPAKSQLRLRWISAHIRHYDRASNGINPDKDQNI